MVCDNYDDDNDAACDNDDDDNDAVCDNYDNDNDAVCDNDVDDNYALCDNNDIGNDAVCGNDDDDNDAVCNNDDSDNDDNDNDAVCDNYNNINDAICDKDDDENDGVCNDDDSNDDVLLLCERCSLHAVALLDPIWIDKWHQLFPAHWKVGPAPVFWASRPLEPAEWLALLILKAGDVESNPGPQNRKLPPLRPDHSENNTQFNNTLACNHITP